ncbi:MAG: rhodanese-like domain-containing protein [Crocinitomicaceae bacterium]|nr:rhodanese-like domain-containing protein [Crocinitomicaceae bacterium]PHR26153.1 MAG: hypothetical protein COA38_15575 [Fluviicola sp.]
MNMRIIFFFLLIGFNSFGQSSDYQEMLKEHYNGFPTISCSAAARKVSDPKVAFIDTREKEEYNVSHIKNALCVGYENFSINSLSLIPKNAEIIVYCSVGIRSMDIGQRLKKAGYTNVKNLYGGFFQWNNSGLPKISSTGSLTSRIHGYSEDWGKWLTKGSIVY